MRQQTDGAREARKRRRCSWRCHPARRSCACRLKGQSAESRTSAQFAQVLIDQLTILRFPLLLGLIIAGPADEIERLLQFSGAIAMVEIGGQQAVLLLQ